MESGPQFDLFQQVVNDKVSDVTWCIIPVVNKKLSEEGSKGNGLASFVSALRENEDKVIFGVIKVDGVDERESVTARRPKFIQVNWVGPKVPAMKKLSALALKNDVSQLFIGVAATVDCNDADDLTTVELGKVLLKSGGAHKPTHYDFGNGETIELSALTTEY